MTGSKSRGLTGAGALALAAAICLALAGCGSDDETAPPACNATTLTGTLSVSGPPSACTDPTGFDGSAYTVYVDTNTDPDDGFEASGIGTIAGTTNYSVDVTGLSGSYFLYMKVAGAAVPGGYYGGTGENYQVPPASANAAVTCGTPLAIKYCD